MNILIAPNAFKQSLTAEEAALAIQEGLQESKLQSECECFPIADGGDGTAELIVKKFGGEVIETPVHNPLGNSINASFGLIENGKTAIVEMAAASGLRLLKKQDLNPLSASSFGTGEQIIVALNQGVKKIIIAMGGSATIDGGCGILRALGARFLDKNNSDITCLPANLTELNLIDTSAIQKRIFDCEVIILCDVENLLTGEKGAAAIFGPQKGANSDDVQLLDTALLTLARVVFQTNGKDITTLKYGGTAGGAAAGLYGLINARLVNGIDYFLEVTGFEEALNKADLVITGEGAIDEQTLQGKGPFGVAAKAKKKGIPVIGVAGSIPLNPSPLMCKYFSVLFSINNESVDLQTALATARENLKRKAKEIGDLLALESFYISMKSRG